MSDTKISALPLATTPLSGAEILPLVQAGASVRAPVSAINFGLTAPTYAAARLLSGVATGDRLQVLGRTSQSDGGQGLFTWVAGGTTTINDGSQLSAPGGIWQRPDVTINAQWYGIDPTGVTASDVALNLAIQDAIIQKKKLVLPSGIFLLNAPLICFRGVFSKVDIEGQGMALIGTVNFPTSPAASYEPNTILCLNSKIVPAIIYQANRYCSLRNLSIQGINTNAFPSPNPPTDTPSDWILAGCATGAQSPYCGIAIDPFTSSAPADGGYAGLASFYGPSPSGSGTSGLFLENIAISEFVVGIANSCAGVLQGDLVRCVNVNIQYCDTGYASGDTQARDNTWFNGQIANVRQAFDTINYGPSGTGVGCNPIAITNVNFGNLYRIFALNNLSAVTVQSCYAESIKTLGQFGKAGASNAYSIEFLGCDFSIQDNIWTSVPLLFEALGPAVFKGCNIGSAAGARDAWNVICGTAGQGLSCSFEQCRFLGSAYTDLPPHIGISFLGRAGARVRDCLVISAGGGTYQITEEYGRSFGIGENANGKGRLRATYRTKTVTDGNLTYNFQPRSTTPYITANCTAASVVIGTTAYTITGITKAASAVVTVSTVSTINPFATSQLVAFAGVVGMVEINGLTGIATAIGGSSGAWTVTVSINSTAFTTYSSGGTATLNTLAFTESTLGEVQLNDILMWLMLPQGYSTIPWSVPAWKVTSIDGSGNCIANPLFDIAKYDTVVNSAAVFGANAVALVLHQWAPTTALTGNTHSNTTLDGLSTSALINGDWVQGVGIPTNTRVVSGGGTASVVLSKAATSTLTGINLYDGQLVASQQQGVYFPTQAGNTSTAPTPTFALGAVQAWTLSNNATWSAPSGAWVAGNRLTLLVTSTGAFTTAWNAVYRNAPAWAVAANGQKATAEFMYDGTNWQFIGGSAAFA